MNVCICKDSGFSNGIHQHFLLQIMHNTKLKKVKKITGTITSKWFSCREKYMPIYLSSFYFFLKTPKEYIPGLFIWKFQTSRHSLALDCFLWVWRRARAIGCLKWLTLICIFPYHEVFVSVKLLIFRREN